MGALLRAIGRGAAWKLASDLLGRVLQYALLWAAARTLGGADFGDSLLKLNPLGSTLAVADYFTPFNQNYLNATDKDLDQDDDRLPSGAPRILQRFVIVGYTPGAPFTRLVLAQEQGAERLGCVFLVKDEAPGVARLRLLMLEPAARGLGLGNRLVGQRDVAGGVIVSVPWQHPFAPHLAQIGVDPPKLLLREIVVERMIVALAALRLDAEE